MMKLETKSKKSLNLLGKKDRLYGQKTYPKPFEFNEEVAQVFDNMVSRSVPLYREVISNIVDWVFHYYQDGSLIYDIGCSTGTTTTAICQSIRGKMAIVGIDTSEPMLALARDKISGLDPDKTVEFFCSDALEHDYRDASFIIVNYTLQFIPVAKRAQLVKKLYDALKPGGVLFISEKIRSNLSSFQETYTRLYEIFKLEAGYSSTEIERKKEALDQVLVPLTIEEHRKLLTDTGFEEFEIVLKWNNFASLAAIKT